MITEEIWKDIPNIRTIFIKGYEQSQQDIIALIQSRIDEILCDAQPAPILRVELQELIKNIEQ